MGVRGQEYNWESLSISDFAYGKGKLRGQATLPDLETFGLECWYRFKFQI